MKRPGMALGVTVIFFIAAPLRAEETPQALLGMTTSQADLLLVDPGLSDVPVPKLVLPVPEPPGRVRLPTLIVRKDEWKGAQCGVMEPRIAVFRHADKWATFWEKALAPVSTRLATVPPVDFNREMVVGVFRGEKPYPHYDIEIRSIKTETRPEGGEALVVRYREITRMMGVFIPPFAVQPFHLKKVSAYPGPVVFLKVRR